MSSSTEHASVYKALLTLSFKFFHWHHRRLSCRNTVSVFIVWFHLSRKGQVAPKGKQCLYDTMFLCLWSNLCFDDFFLRWYQPKVATFFNFYIGSVEEKTVWLGIHQVNFKCIHDHSLWPPRRRNLEEVEIAKKHPMAIITMQYSRQISWKE